MAATRAGMTDQTISHENANTGEPTLSGVGNVGANVIRARDTQTQNAPSRMALTNAKTASTASTSSFKARSTSRSPPFLDAPNLAERRRRSNDNYAALPNVGARSSPVATPTS